MKTNNDLLTLILVDKNNSRECIRVLYRYYHHLLLLFGIELTDWHKSLFEDGIILPLEEFCLYKSKKCDLTFVKEYLKREIRHLKEREKQYINHDVFNTVSVHYECLHWDCIGMKKMYIGEIPMVYYKKFIVFLMKEFKLNKKSAFSLYKIGIKDKTCILDLDFFIKDSIFVFEKLYGNETVREIDNLFREMYCTFLRKQNLVFS